MKCVVRTLVSAPDELSRAGLLRLLAKSRYKATTAKGSLDTLLDEADSKNTLIIVVLGKGARIPSSTIHALTQRCKVALVADHCDGTACYDALCAGAAAYVPRTISGQALLDALDLVLEGEVVFPSFLVEEVFGCPRDQSAELPPPPEKLVPTDVSAKLSAREIEIVQRLVQGASNKHISRDLNIAETTVKVHVKTILRKLKASNRTQAAIWGLTYLPALPEPAVEAPEPLPVAPPALGVTFPAPRRVVGNQHQVAQSRLSAVEMLAAAMRPVRVGR